MSTRAYLKHEIKAKTGSKLFYINAFYGNNVVKVKHLKMPRILKIHQNDL